MVLCSSSPARERGTGSCTGSESALWSQRARGVEVAGAHPPVSPPTRCFFFFAPGFTHVFLALAHELPEVLNSVDLLAQHGTQLPVQLRQRGLRVQHSPKPVRVLGVRPDRRVRAALRDEGRGNVTTTVRKKKTTKEEDRRREGEERATDFKKVPGRARPLSPEEKDSEATATAPLAALTFL